MKTMRKILIGILATVAVSAIAIFSTGCNPAESIKKKIEQARCEHEWNDGEVTKEATCMEKGELTKTCTLCEKVETEEIELAEHIAVYVQAVTPTCLEKGVTDGTVCSVCETKISGFQEIPALGHIVVKDSAVKPTCLEIGLTEGEHCSRCNEVLKAQEKVPATGHNLVILEAVEPTCTTEGKTQGVECSVCKEVFTEPETIPVLEHIDEDKDYVCDFCGFVDTSTWVEKEVALGTEMSGYFRLYEGGCLLLNGGPIKIIPTEGLVGANSLMTIGIISCDGIIITHYDGYCDIYIAPDAILEYSVYHETGDVNKYSFKAGADTLFTPLNEENLPYLKALVPPTEV